MKHLSLSNQAAFSWSAQWICVTILNISKNCMENFGLVHTKTFSFENAYSLDFGLASTPRVFLSRKTKLFKTLSKVDKFKNAVYVL